MTDRPAPATTPGPGTVHAEKGARIVELKVYPVNIGGIEHPMQLSEETARRMGVAEKAAPKPKNKARTPRNKAKGSAAGEPAAAADDDTEW